MKSAIDQLNKRNIECKNEIVSINNKLGSIDWKEYGSGIQITRINREQDKYINELKKIMRKTSDLKDQIA